jgi:hypothetical protein
MRDSTRTQASYFSGENVKRITKAVLGGVAGCGLILVGTQAATGEPPNIVYSKSGVLTDLLPSDEGPLDGASYAVRIVDSPDEGTGFRLRVTDIDPSAEGEHFGAHLHVGACAVAEDGTNSTSIHYKADANPASSENEVWFDLEPDEEGVANDETWVSFRPNDTNVDPTPDVMSIVIHVHEADVLSGNPKQACLPVTVSDWVWSPAG